MKEKTFVIRNVKDGCLYLDILPSTADEIEIDMCSSLDEAQRKYPDAKQRQKKEIKQILTTKEEKE